MNSTKENHECTICYKSFLSQKALFGHMRLHPDRPWRGMQPPTTPAPATAPVSSPPLPCWTVTAKRGRTTISTGTSSSSASTSGTSSAVSELAGNDDIDLVHHPSKSENSATQKIVKGRKIKMDYKLKSVSNSDSVISADHHDEYQIQLKNVNYPKKLYRCNSCDREFSSHQALGGHKSSHNQTMTVSGLTDHQPSQRRKVLDFDLNELPPMDKEEEEEEAIQFI